MKTPIDPMRAAPDPSDTPLAHAPCFIETQFPVAKASVESYKDLARGFGAADYTDLLASAKANETRLRSATGFGPNSWDTNAAISSGLFAV